MAQESGLRIGSFAGAPIIVEPAFLLLAAYVAVMDVMRGGVEALPGALVFVGVIFAAVLIHEFGHAAVAAALRIPSKRIVVTFFGGYVQFERPPQRRWHEIAVSAAGPGANLLTWAVLLAAAPTLANMISPTPLGIGFMSALQSLALISLLLGAFNLLPGFPLDGGHIVRAGLSYVMSRRAARIATAISGLAIAVLLVIAAVRFQLLWTALIALLLGLAAWAELIAARANDQGAAAD